MPSPLVQRTYRTGDGELTISIGAPRREGGDWFCDVTATGAEETQLPVGGVDAWQALRLAMRAADAIIDGHPGATCDGIPGAF